MVQWRKKSQKIERIRASETGQRDRTKIIKKVRQYAGILYAAEQSDKYTRFSSSVYIPVRQSLTGPA